jgi:ornithine cyclodeaminase/alanine dehydrogenase-like protein (mu-crystallin family)
VTTPHGLKDLAIIDGPDVARLLPYLELVDALEAGHRRSPAVVRRTVLRPDGTDQSFLGLPAWSPGGQLGVKLVTVFPGNTGLPEPVPSVQAVYVLFDGSNGSPLALIDGTELTYRKTAADSALGSRLLSRPDAHTLLMVGAGGLAPHLIAAHRAVRPSIERVLLWNRTRARADAVAGDLGAEVVEDLASAVPEADIVCTATMTTEPLVEGRWLRPGAHLDLVGAFLPDRREVDDEAVVRAELYVDTREVTTVEDGDLAIPLAAGTITVDDIRADLYQLCRGEVVVDRRPGTITLFENGGGGHLDLMTAELLWQRWRDTS